MAPGLWRLFGVLLFGVTGREILMDCTDVTADSAAGIRTVPVVHGKLFATKVATGCSLVMSLLATMPAIRQILATQGGTNSSILLSAPVRRLTLAGMASVWQLRRNWQIFKTKGEDSSLISQTVNESLLTVVLLLASFV